MDKKSRREKFDKEYPGNSAHSSVINVRVDAKIKNQSTKILTTMGMNMSTAVNILLAQIIKDQKFPFTPSIKK